MKKTGLTLRGLSVPILISIIMITLMASAAPSATKPEPITFKAISFVALSNPSVKMFPDLVERINKRARGELAIKIVGGPEAISDRDQIQATKSGVVDFAFAAPAYYEREAPENVATFLSRLTPREELDTGFNKIVNEIHNKIGLYYLGLATPTAYGMYLYTNGRIKNPRVDFKGLKIRSAAMYNPFLLALGATPTEVPFGEVYTALERGMVDGAAGSATAIRGSGWHEALKYRIDHTFYKSNVVYVINLNSWNRLPKHLQDLIVDEYWKQLPEVEDFFRKQFDETNKVFKDKGMQLIKFSPEDAKWYVDLAYKVGWEGLLKNSPEYGRKLKELSDKGTWGQSL